MDGRTLYEIDLGPERTVQLRELTAEEFEQMVSQLDGSAPDYGWKITQDGLRRSIVRDGTEELTYKQLLGPLLARRFATRELLTLRQAWEQLHMPGKEENARVRAMRAVVG